MHDLVDFLVEEKYCNTESEAIKILESVSDEFYDSLVEAQVSAITSTAEARKRMDAEMKKVGKPEFNPNLVKHLRKKIAGLKGPASAELTQSKSKGLQKTPTGPKGRRVQKTEEEGINPLNDPRVAAAAEREADKETGTKGEVSKAGGASNQPTRRLRQTQYSRTSGGRGTNIGRAGGVATGE
jgi:hypothetical protein